MKCVVSGGTGFIGKRLVDRLLKNGHEVSVWSRKPGSESGGAVRWFVWDPLKGEPPEESLNETDAVFHLAGEPVVQRWNEAAKQRIHDSRVLGTRRLVDAIKRVPRKPRVLVCASAVGYYGDRGDEVLTEASRPGTGFLADVCRQWEAEATRAEELGLRVAKLRIGFVLGKDGGALGQMLPVFRAFIGGRLGSGKQWMPWIHVADVVQMFIYAAESGISGVWNATSPNPVTNAEFTRELGAVLHRPAIFSVPRFALGLAFGEFGPHMLDSARAMPDGAFKAGYDFRYPELGPALRNLLDAS